MTHTTTFLREFIKQFRRMPKDVELRVRNRIIELSENPYLGLSLVGDLKGFWKDRIGKYRILYRIDENRKTIIFYDVDLRKRIYE